MIYHKQFSPNSLKVYGLVLIGLLTICSALVLLLAQSSHAANAKDFNPGRIIDDAVFYNSSAMNASQIQTFLNAKNPNCDTDGTKPASDWGRSDITHATLASYLRNGTNGYTKDTGFHTPPYTCLKNFKQNTPQMEAASGLCSSLAARTNRTAAQIIDDVAKACGVNPQVLIVLLQKEQSLVTDTWPLNRQYQKATGFACPDTAPCNPAYNSFFYQVYHAARQFKVYKKYPTDYNYVAGRTNRIYWHPDLSRCGSSDVYIQNQATAALYIYTPYRPNQSALNNLYSTGDSCSSYGNRNFWRLFTDWFGSTTGGTPRAYGITITKPITLTTNGDGSSTVSFTVKNTASTRVSFDKTIIQCRSYQNSNCDSNEGGSWYVDPGQERIFSYSINISEANTYKITPYISMGGVWYQYDTASGIPNMITVQKPQMTITSAISLSPNKLSSHSTNTVSFQLKNTGKSPINISQTVVQCRYNGLNCDSNYGGAITVNIGETKTFNYTFSTLEGGNHTLIPYFMVDGMWYTYTPTAGTSSSRIINVAELELEQSGVTLSNNQPVSGETIEATFSATNKGTQPINLSRIILQCRQNTTGNCDPEYHYNITINPGEEKEFTSNIRTERSGSYQLTPYFEYGGQWYTYNKGSAPDNKRVVNVERYEADMRLTGDISITPTNPLPGDNVTVSYTVKNFGNKAANYQRSILQCRLNTSTMCDPSYNSPYITIQPDQSRTFSNTFTAIKPGTYRFVPYFEQNDTWRMYSKGTASNNLKEVFINPLTMTTGVTLSPTNPSVGSTVTAKYKVKNLTSSTITVSDSILQCRRDTNFNCDSTMGSALTFAPGQEREFVQTFRISQTGTYRLVPYYRVNKQTWYTYGNLSGVTPNLTLNVN